MVGPHGGGGGIVGNGGGALVGGLAQYQALPLLERFAARGVPFTTASDAHRYEQVADRAADLRSLLDAVGVGELQGYEGRVPHRVAVGSPPPPSEEG